MFIKKRCRSPELLRLEALNRRMVLEEKDQKAYFTLEKGFAGECMFDACLEGLNEERIILSDLAFQVGNHTQFQIDTLVISEEGLQIFEVKNFEGDYEYKKDNFYFLRSSRNINNPLHQLNRSETLFKQLLQQLGFNFPVSGSVVFVNPEFTLYHAPDHLPIVFPTQLNRLIQTLNSNTSKLTKRHLALAEKLIETSIKYTPPGFVPEYNFENMTKGIICKSCGSLKLVYICRNFVCEECGCKEESKEGLIRSVKEYSVLYPNRKITTQEILNWTQLTKHKKLIRTILKSHFRQCGNRKSTYFVPYEE